MLIVLIVGNAAEAVTGGIGPRGPQGPQGPKGDTGPAGENSCTPYHLGDTGPDLGIVFYVDGSACHGLEVQVSDVAPRTWGESIVNAAKLNTTTITKSLSCSITSAQTMPNCWHLPTRNELSYLYEQRKIVQGLSNVYYWSSTEVNNGVSWSQSFNAGNWGNNNKKDKLISCSVRSF